MPGEEPGLHSSPGAARAGAGAGGCILGGFGVGEGLGIPDIHPHAHSPVRP